MTRAERLARRTDRRTAARILRERAAANRLQASLNRGRSLATHLIAAGVDADTARGAAGGLRTVAKRLGVIPVKVVRTHRTTAGRAARLQRVGHYTAAQVAVLVAAYRPRKAAYREAVARYSLAA